MSPPNKPPRYPTNNGNEKAKRILRKYQKTRSLLINTLLKNAEAEIKFPDHRHEVLSLRTTREFGESSSKGGVTPDEKLNLEPFCGTATTNHFPPKEVPYVMPTVGPFAAPSLLMKKEKLDENVLGIDLSGIPVGEDLRSVPVDIDLDVADPPVTEEGYTNFSVVVRSLRPRDVGVMYTIHGNETFDSIYCDYAHKIDVSPSEIRLPMWNNDRSVLRSDKPDDVKLNSGDVMYVMGKPHVLNVATRVKVFYITEVSRDPIKVKVSGFKDTLLVGLFHKWAEAANSDPSKVLFIHERKSLATVDTIGSAKIENGDEIVAVVLNE